MMFIRVVFSHRLGRVRAVQAQDTLFRHAGINVPGDECQNVDLGMVDRREWRDARGEPCSPSRALLEALEPVDIGEARAGSVERVRFALQQALGDVMACPCSLDDIRKQLRERGPASLPVKARAWLTLTLQDDTLRGLGPIWQGIPPSVLAAMERIRVERDPESGSRLDVILRLIQRESDARSAKALARRRAGASAWEDMTQLIGDRDGETLA